MTDESHEKRLDSQDIELSAVSNNNPQTNQDRTNRAILDQLVYIDNFIGEDNDLNFDLSAFADESFVFADEDKPNNNDINALVNSGNEGHRNHDNANRNIDNEFGNRNNNSNRNDDFLNRADSEANEHQLNNLPRFPVPPGAKTSLQAAGLNQNQIDFLSALIAQHQSIQQMNGSGSNDASNGDFSHPETINEYIERNLPTKQRSEPSATRPMNIFYNQSRRHTPESSITNSGSLTSDPQTSQSIQQALQSPMQQQSQSNLLSQDPISMDGGADSISSSGVNTPAASEIDLYKRRRNTAASARFRVKKKLKEKQMEEKIESLQDIIKTFEGKIKTLELENKLLKNLIIEKGSEKSENDLKLFKEKILGDHD